MNQGNQGNQPQQILQQGQHTRSQAQIPTIQLKYVGQFVQALKKEGALAQAATNEADRAKHYAKVESLRQILKKYQTMQQNARQQQQIQMNPQQTPQGSTMNPRLSTSNPGSSQIANRQGSSPVPQSMPQNLAAQRQNAGPSLCTATWNDGRCTRLYPGACCFRRKPQENQHGANRGEQADQ